jgi:hypothetical protein
MRAFLLATLSLCSLVGCNTILGIEPAEIGKSSENAPAPDGNPAAEETPTTGDPSTPATPPLPQEAGAKVEHLPLTLEGDFIGLFLGPAGEGVRIAECQNNEKTRIHQLGPQGQTTLAELSDARGRCAYVSMADSLVWWADTVPGNAKINALKLDGIGQRLVSFSLATESSFSLSRIVPVRGGPAAYAISGDPSALSVARYTWDPGATILRQSVLPFAGHYVAVERAEAATIIAEATSTMPQSSRIIRIADDTGVATPLGTLAGVASVMTIAPSGVAVLTHEAQQNARLVYRIFRLVGTSVTEVGLTNSGAWSLPANGAMPLAADTKDMYWIDPNNNIVRLTAAGTPVVVVSNANAHALTLTANALYWVTKDSPRGLYRLDRR